MHLLLYLSALFFFVWLAGKIKQKVAAIIIGEVSLNRAAACGGKMS